MASISSGFVGAINEVSQAGKSPDAFRSQFGKFTKESNSSQIADLSVRLSLSGRFNTEVQRVNQATMDINDGITMAQIADKGLAQIEQRQSRLQELAVLSSTQSLTVDNDNRTVVDSDEDRQAIQVEAQQIQVEIASIVANTKYNGINLLASNGTIYLQTGPASADQTGIKLTDFTKVLGAVDLSYEGGAQRAMVAITSDIEQVRASRSALAATGASLAAYSSQLTDLSQTLSGAGSTVRDVDIYDQSSQRAAANILSQARQAIQTQANQFSARVFQLVS